MKSNDYTKILLENQKEYLTAQKELTTVLAQMKDALNTINDTNILHCSKEDERYNTIDKLATAVEARAKVMNTIFILLAIAIVILAGAEKALQFIRL